MDLLHLASLASVVAIVLGAVWKIARMVGSVDKSLGGLHSDFHDFRKSTDEKLDDLSASAGDTRERLAYIEGKLDDKMQRPVRIK